jgi:hypothetical protein
MGQGLGGLRDHGRRASPRRDRRAKSRGRREDPGAAGMAGEARGRGRGAAEHPLSEEGGLAGANPRRRAPPRRQPGARRTRGNAGSKSRPTSTRSQTGRESIETSFAASSSRPLAEGSEGRRHRACRRLPTGFRAPRKTAAETRRSSKATGRPRKTARLLRWPSRRRGPRPSRVQPGAARARQRRGLTLLGRARRPRRHWRPLRRAGPPRTGCRETRRRPGSPAAGRGGKSARRASRSRNRGRRPTAVRARPARKGGSREPRRKPLAAEQSE